ncbi:MAG: MBOAT family protein [Chthoniobacter sp.]|nr:MBOAT family protein [Chthoniobacter sp.]
MLFNSYPFILVFLPLCLLGVFLFGKFGWTRAASLWLSAASLGFYAWWNPDPTAAWSPKYLGIIVGSIVANYLLGVRISAAVGRGAPAAAKAALTFGVVANLGVLAYFKYANFLVENFNALAGTHVEIGRIALPLAISFFTFTQIAYLVDAFHGVTKEYNFRWYLLFVSFFPHLIAGPIVLYRSLMPQFAKAETWRFNAENFAGGLTLFAFGLFKKAVIADTLSPLANAIFESVAHGSQPGACVAWVGALAYTLQLYFDFSGYSDMAIGVGMMFNVRFPLNFNSPYKARDIADFWRRWHITLSTFLRDHLYIPLGGNRHGPIRRYSNLFLTMLLGGLWHGAGWTFVVWGALHGSYLIVNHAWVGAIKGQAWAQAGVMRFGGRMVTLLAVIVGWVFFRAKTVPQAVEILAGMVGANGAALPLQLKPQLAAVAARLHLDFAIAPFKVQALWMVAVATVIALCAPNTDELFRLAIRTKESTSEPLPVWRPSTGWAVLTALVLAVSIFQLSGVTEFLYFQF